MDIEVKYNIDDVFCEARVIDPHGNVEFIMGQIPEELVTLVSETVLWIYEACLLAEEENK